MYDHFEESAQEEGDDGQPSQRVDSKEFIVQMFGINEKGETCAIYASGFTPFFYVKVDKSWYKNQGKLMSFKAQIVKEIGNYYQDSIVSMKYISRKNTVWFSMAARNIHLLK